MFCNKKAQTSIFMIIGVVLLIGGAVFFYTSQNVRQVYEPEVKIVEQQVPIEFDPVRKFANDCAYAVAVEGLKIIGKQGGYISFSNKNLNREDFKILKEPTESEAVSFSEGSDLKTAYWYYLKSPNDCRQNCGFASKRPDLRSTDNSIEKQLERYINLKFAECLRGFEPFKDQGYQITQDGKINSDVTIALDDITIIVNYPIVAEKQGTNAKISQFIANVPIDLDNIYGLATKVTNMQIEHKFLEKHILNLLVAFSGPKPDKLPPMSEMQFKLGSGISWQKSDVKSKVTGMVASYIPLFQVDGTYNYNRNIFGSELKQRLYDSAIIPIANDSFKDLTAEFAYLDFWPMYFNLNCKGERCIPSSANSLISSFGIQEYRFTYDMSYPVLVEVKDPYALNGQGYSFNFFLEGNIRRNKPMATGFAPLERAVLSERSLLCDSRTSGNVSVNIVDAVTKRPIEDAQILYTVTDESCFIGSTDKNGAMKDQFPVAVGGIASVVKDGYIGKSEEFDARLNSPSALRLEMQPIFEGKKVIVKKKNIVKTENGWRFSNAAVELNDKESVTLQFVRSGDANELGFSVPVNYDGKTKQPEEISIAPGKYSVEGYLILKERIIIPEKQKCVKKGILGEKECFTLPKFDFGEKSTPGQEQFQEGGLKLNLSISEEDLQSHDTIVFYMISTDIANVPENERAIGDIEQLGNVESHSITYQKALQPTFE